MSEFCEVTEHGWDFRTIEIIVSQVELLEMAKVKETAVGIEITKKPTTAKIKVYNMAGEWVASDAVPRAAIAVLLPRFCFRNVIRTGVKIIIIIIFDRKRVFEMEQSKALVR